MVASVQDENELLRQLFREHLGEEKALEVLCTVPSIARYSSSMDQEGSTAEAEPEVEGDVQAEANAEIKAAGSKTPNFVSVVA